MGDYGTIEDQIIENRSRFFCMHQNFWLEKNDFEPDVKVFNIW